MLYDGNIKLLTYLAAPPTITRKFRSSDHILRVVRAFPKSCPFVTVRILVCAVATTHIHSLVKRVHMYPLCCWPFLTFNYRAPSMKTAGIGGSIRVETEEKKCISSSWFHYMLQSGCQNKPILDFACTRITLHIRYDKFSKSSPAIPFLAHSERSSVFACPLRRGGSYKHIGTW